MSYKHTSMGASDSGSGPKCSRASLGVSALAVCTAAVLAYGAYALIAPQGKAGTCTVTSVTYPTVDCIANRSMPECSGTLTTCDCGKRCTSDSGVCLSVYVNYLEDGAVQADGMLVPNWDSRHQACTRTEKRCSRGERMEDRVSAFNDAESEALGYHNATLGCYLRSDYILMDDEGSLELCVLLAICSCICLLVACFAQKIVN